MYQLKPSVPDDRTRQLEQELLDARARLAKVEADKESLARRVEALEARPAKVELGEEFDGIRELSYHLKHGGLTPFLADRAWWPNLGTHIMWAMIAFIVIMFGWAYLEHIGLL
jgi:hypothetical protein